MSSWMETSLLKRKVNASSPNTLVDKLKERSSPDVVKRSLGVYFVDGGIIISLYLPPDTYVLTFIPDVIREVSSSRRLAETIVAFSGERLKIFATASPGKLTP